MEVDARGKLPGVLVLAGAGAVVASTFLPWREGTPPLVVSLAPDGWFLAGFAMVQGGVVGLVMLVRGSNTRLAALGILLALVVSFIIISDDYSSVANQHTSGQLKLIPDIGPGPYVSAVGVIAMVIGSASGFATRRVANPRPATAAKGNDTRWTSYLLLVGTILFLLSLGAVALIDGAALLSMVRNSR